MRFTYSLIRFVPDPSRGEFVNVGAIAGSEESSEWAIRQIENPVRARAVDENKSLDAVWSFIDRIGAAIDEYELSIEQLFDSETELSEDWLEQLHSDHRNVVQLSPPTPLVADSAEEALDLVFQLAVLDPAHRRYRFLKKHSALAAMRQAYRARSIQQGRDFTEKIKLQTAHHQGRIDFAVVNSRALQLTHTWSFQNPDQEALAEQVRSWGWVMQDAQRSGGTVTTRTEREYRVDPNVDIEVVYIPPLVNQPQTTYEGALDVFDTLGVKYTTVDEADDVAERAEGLLQHAGKGRLDLGK